MIRARYRVTIDLTIQGANDDEIEAKLNDLAAAIVECTDQEEDPDEADLVEIGWEPIEARG